MTNLYKVLGVKTDAAPAAVAKAYRLLALRYHPDRNPDGAEQFKAISAAYEVPSDADARQVYDATGRVPGGGEDPDESDAERAARFGDAIKKFYETYRGSPEEVADLTKAYGLARGSFRLMMTERCLVSHDYEGEVTRIHAIVAGLVALGTLEATPRWEKSTTDKALAKLEGGVRSEAAEAEEMLREMNEAAAPSGGDGDMAALALMISNRQARAQEWDSMTDGLAAKYAGLDKKKKKGKKAVEAEDEAEPAEAPRRKKKRSE